MYVCLCNAYRDGELRGAVQQGAGTVEEAYAALGGALLCGGCRACAQDVIDEAREAGAAADRAPAPGIAGRERAGA